MGNSFETGGLGDVSGKEKLSAGERERMQEMIDAARKDRDTAQAVLDSLKGKDLVSSEAMAGGIRSACSAFSHTMEEMLRTAQGVIEEMDTRIKDCESRLQ